MLNASIVLYKHTYADIATLLKTLSVSPHVADIYIVDNSPERSDEFDDLEKVLYVFNGENLGYGKAHNIAIRKTLQEETPYHLVVNPDVVFDPDILSDIVNFMDNNPEIGHLMPKVLYPSGDVQYLCKLLPTPSDLLFRRFLPRAFTRKRMETFELRYSGYDHIMDVPYLSGCFMFLRTGALKEVGLFDERFFMYPEDIDLTRRIHRKYRTVYYPGVSIIHGHAQSSYKDSRMLFVHIMNLVKYFNKWGWAFDKERRQVNRKIRQQITNGSN